MIITLFEVKNKEIKLQIFEIIFLIENLSKNVVLKMLFFIVSNVEKTF